ncbi:MAG: hypothetical protein GXP47_09185 [Acidobacteria bacterium]|nr:hypothetical protein [Acidobacteriota bacterium]
MASRQEGGAPQAQHGRRRQQPPRIDEVEPSPHPPGSPGQVLSEALWPGRPRIAAAIDAAHVDLVDGELRLTLPAEAAGLADFLREDEAASRVSDAATRHLEGFEVLRVSVEGEDAAGGGPSKLRALAESDDGVVMVQRVLGGTIRTVVPDEGGEG